MAGDEQLLAGRTILLVDDEKYTLRMVKTVLTSIGAREVLEAVRAEEAVLHLRDPLTQIDCMIADFNMPGINGLLMVKAIRCGTHGLRRDLPIVMLTGHTDAAVVVRAKALDVNGFISKPVSKAALTATFQRIFAERFTARSVDEYRRVDTLMNTGKPSANAEPEAEADPPRAPEPRLIRVDELTPGATVARDLVIVEGLSVVAGTVLNPRLIDILRKLNTIEALDAVAVA